MTEHGSRPAGALMVHRLVDGRLHDRGPGDSGSAALVVQGGPKSPPDAFLTDAARLIEADPRVASVSWSDSVVAWLAPGARLPGPEGEGASGLIQATEPAGDAVVVSPSALALLGEPSIVPGRAVGDGLAEWAGAAAARGLRHLWWTSGADGTDDPWLPVGPVDRADAQDPLSPVSLLRDRHVAAHRSLAVGVEASALGPQQTGAQVAIVAWLDGLLARPDVSGVWLWNLPHGRLPHYARHLAARSGVHVVGREDPEPRVDVFWRPTQPGREALVSLDRGHGRRLVVTVLDLIEFSNPRYHASDRSWIDSRAQARRYLRQADVVSGITDDVLDAIRSEVPGVTPERLVRTSLGVDHLDLAGPLEPTARSSPPGLEGLGRDRPFLLVLGNDYLHKNRDFAIEVWRRVAADEPVDLVLAGLHVGRGSSRSAERDLLASRGAVASGPRVHVLGHVDGRSRIWLLAHAAAVLYPSSAEGFGLVPFEAAAVGTPSVHTRFGPLRELLGESPACSAWDVGSHADATLHLLRDPSAARSACESVRAAAQPLTWQSSAGELVSAFRAALALPPHPWGLWERVGGGSALLDSPMDPLPPTDARRAAARMRYGRGWRARVALASTRGRLGRIRRSLNR